MSLENNQIYVYCYYPNNRFAYATDLDIPATPEDHCMSKYIVTQSSIPNNPEDKTFDGTNWADIEGIEEERNLFQLRQERNRLLAETDWWVLPDRTATQEQLDYREALRNITNIYSSLSDVVWPNNPMNGE